MAPRTNVIAFLVAWLGVIACSSPSPGGKDRSPRLDEKTKDDDVTAKEAGAPVQDRTNAPASDPTPTDAGVPDSGPTFPRAASASECLLGDGLYCAGNGVDGIVGR